ILLETSLSFLGFGITAPDISLGQIISEYNEAFKTRPWLFWWPGLFIVVIALCINFIGDGLRDAFDPRQKRVPRQRSLGSEIGTFFKAYVPGARPGARPGDGTSNK
ncbi:MAG: ABC transporter permease, partial [Salinibacterium amurskyense]